MTLIRSIFQSALLLSLSSGLVADDRPGPYPDIDVSSVQDLASGPLAEFIDRWQPPLIAKNVGDPGVAVYQKTCQSVVFVGTKKGLGSGSVVSSKGLVLTNAHVIRGAEKAQVAILDRCDHDAKPKAYSARVVLRDPGRDLAFLLLTNPPKGLKPIAFGSIKDVQVGARVYALGHPKGMTWSLSQGLVSQVRKNFKIKSGSRVSVIQTDAAVNPGNSGGPLLLPDGRQIGVNTFILRKVGNLTMEGLNYAVASDEVVALVNEAKAGKKTRTGSIEEKNEQANRDPVTPPVKKKCKTVKVFQGRDESLGGNVKIARTACAKLPNYRLLVPDDKSRPVYVDLDRNSDSLPDVHLIDTNRDGKVDLSFWDDNFDKRFELMGKHPDGKVAPASREAIPPVLPVSKSIQNDPVFKSIAR